MDNFHFSVHPVPGNRYQVTIRARDFIGLLSVITGLFASSGINILRATIGTVGRQAEDIFEVSAPATMDWPVFEKDLSKLLSETCLKNTRAVFSKINKRIIGYLRDQSTEYSKILPPINLKIDQQRSVKETVVSIQSQDTPAFLYELTNALTQLGINIVQMEANTAGNQVQDTLWLTENGEKITSDQKLKSLQWAILFVKQFTHLLPRVPDPESALEQFTLLGKDLFERQDFELLLGSLKKSNVLEDLSQVLGSSRFLWEELIRGQYESIIPIFENRKLLEHRKTRLEMASELEQLLNSKSTEEEKVDALNEYKDREMFRIDLRHLIGKAPYLGEFTEEFTDLSEAVVKQAYRLAFSQAYRKLKEPVFVESFEKYFSVFALGKFGGRELGYASDLEVLFVYRDPAASESYAPDEALNFYSGVVRQFRKMIHAKCKGVFEIDMRLRPYGADGPLASSIEAFKKYYGEGGESWNFERQALLKLRFIAGDPDLGREVESLRNAYVFSEKPFDFKEALKLRVRQQKELVENLTLNAKYSPGGLLDIEYLVQTLQITYGRKIDGGMHSPNTLKALRALWQAGLLTERQFQELRASYIFLRGVINALRIVRGNARDLALPAVDSEEYVILGRRLGFHGRDAQIRAQFRLICQEYTSLAATHYETFMTELAQRDWQKILKEDIRVESISRPSLDNLLKGDFSGTDKKLLSEMGFQNFLAVQAHMGRLCPSAPAFEYFAKTLDYAWPLWKKNPDPDLALKHLTWYVENVANPEVFWKETSHSSQGLEVLLKIFGTSCYLSSLVIADPNGHHWVLNQDGISLEYCREVMNALGQEVVSLEGLREFRHRETLRIALVEMLTETPLGEIYEIYSDLADQVIRQIYQRVFPEGGLSVLGLGKLGARELNFSSDVDLMFLLSTGADEAMMAAKVQEFLNELKQGDLTHFLYRVDLRLRPHGDDGNLFMTLKDYQHYYQQTADTWEYQALIKMRPLIDDQGAGTQLLQEVAPLIWRAQWKPEDIQRLREIKRLYEAKTREKKEWETHIKMGGGGIRDIEFTAQMIQLRYGARYPELRKTSTLEALKVIESLRLLDETSLRILSETYLLLRGIENRLHLFENRQTFLLPAETAGKRRLAKSLGYEANSGEAAEVIFEKQLKTKRQKCREIFEKVFFSDDFFKGPK